eukprot:TRINITY_DN26125_c0_g1_i1.p1 TRINITY_DN26125_c0_g1~~TRINITY_DN26125_c0_g1_i1.p1  ORF type:complete len:310 (+),score=57.76 TRINITY_DN26125_c0_g1_i1:30-932(+)
MESRVDVETFANLLTLKEYQLLKAVQPEELDGVGWATADPSHSANLKEVIRWSNQYTYWIVSTVLLQDDLEHRVNKVSYFLELGEALLRKNNFNGASLTILALRHPALFRIKSIWSRLSPDHTAMFEKLYAIFLRSLDEPSDDYTEYRRLLRLVKGPYIPFYRFHLEEVANFCTDPKDPTLSTRHYKCTVRGVHIYGSDHGPQNLPLGEKILRITKAVFAGGLSGEYIYECKTDFNIEQYLNNYVALSNDACYSVSLLIEPRKKGEASQAPTPNLQPFLAGALLGAAITATAFFLHKHPK